MRGIGIACAIASVSVALLGVGCGAGSHRSREVGTTSVSTRSVYRDSMQSQQVSTDSDSEGDYAVSEASYAYEQTVPADLASAPTTVSTGSGSTGMDGEYEDASAAPPPAPTAELYAQAQTSTTTPEATASDAVDTSRELLIYTALFHVGVYDVTASQAAIAESARTAGGFVFQQSDDRIVVRVPAARFRAFTETVEGIGDVIHRQIDAQDVGEEFRDIEIRIRNLEAVRDRIADLLERGLTVEQVLVVERELERVTSELERMRGRQRYLADRIAYSTITVLFQPAPREAIDQPDVFRLPFPWLDSLGLSNLLNLR